MNKTVLITGASSGIGFELALLFAKDNYKLYLVANNIENLRNAADKIEKKYPNTIIKTLAKDLSLKDSPNEIYNEIKTQNVFIDILVNNAGTQVYGAIQNTDVKKQLDLLQVNLISLTHLSMLFLKDMVDAKKGKILNVASIGGFAPAPLNAIYCAGKAYVLSFSEAIRRDLENTGVSITCLCPGATKTNFIEKAGIQDIRLFQSFVMKPEKVAKQGYIGLNKNRAIVIPGLYNKIMVLSIRFTPRNLITLIGKYLMDRK